MKIRPLSHFFFPDSEHIEYNHAILCMKYNMIMNYLKRVFCCWHTHITRNTIYRLRGKAHTENLEQNYENTHLICKSTIHTNSYALDTTSKVDIIIIIIIIIIMAWITRHKYAAKICPHLIPGPAIATTSK